MNGHARLSTVARSTSPPKLLDLVPDRVRRLGGTLSGPRLPASLDEIYTRSHGKRHPREMGKAEVEAFLTKLAVERHVAAATQPPT